MKMRAQWMLSAVLLGLVFATGCSIGPKYERPVVQSPAAYKELTPADFPQTDGWKVAQPSDAALHGKWWEMFNDTQLNALEEQVSVSNQNVASAAASFLEARTLVKEARSQYFPTVTTNPSITNERNPAAPGNGASSIKSFTDYSLPFDASWQPDLWGRIRNTVSANASAAQASAADLENVRLTAQSEVAVDYFELRGEDSLKDLLDSTVMAYQQSLDLTQALYDTGIDSDESVAQAETQLEATQAQDTAVSILRAQYEHAIALLVGQPASTFSIPMALLTPNPQAIPLGVPSQLLERRPDIAASERLMAQANSQIGIARAAYYPTVTLSGAAGLASTAITTWFTWPARLWSVGPLVSETIFDGGLRRATNQQFEAAYNVTTANYRETVLTAFQQIEDNLASLRLLSKEIQQQGTAVKSAQRNLGLANDRYRLGIDPYLNVITAQTTLLSNQQTAVNLSIQQMTSTVQLIEALGGGWDDTQLPTPQSFIAKTP
jgi:NodT family efflux transporter outer membrane factor (OMF) lipoprotein